jgi:hypothetical protein
LKRDSSKSCLDLNGCKVVDVDLLEKVLEDLALLEDLCDSKKRILLPVHLGDADPVTAVVVDQNVLILAFETNVTKVVRLTPKDVNITLAIIRMIVGNALLASGPIQRKD